MPAVLPPNLTPPPAIVAPAPACHLLSKEEALVAFQRLRKRLPSTEFAGARPSEICGMVRVELARGTVAYTDATGRYFLLAFALDTHRGSPADTSETIDKVIDARSTNPMTPGDSRSYPAEPGPIMQSLPK